MALIIGLTGSIASGKSTVSKMFNDLNIPVVDADKLSREVVEPGEEAYREIVRQFGDTILHKDNTINREKLGSIVFTDEKKRKQLNNIVHPAVRKAMQKEKDELIEAQERCIVLDIPLLYESNLTHYVEKIIVVYVDEAVQLKRLMKRNGYSEEEAMQRIKSQLPVKEKASLADAVIDNNGTINESYEQLQSLLKKWQVL